MKNLSIKAKLQIVAFLSIIIVSILIATSSIYSVNELSKIPLKSFQKMLITKSKKNLKIMFL